MHLIKFINLYMFTLCQDIRIYNYDVYLPNRTQSQQKSIQFKKKRSIETLCINKRKSKNIFFDNQSLKEEKHNKRFEHRNLCKTSINKLKKIDCKFQEPRYYSIQLKPTQKYKYHPPKRHAPHLINQTKIQQCQRFLNPNYKHNPAINCQQQELFERKNFYPVNSTFINQNIIKPQIRADELFHLSKNTQHQKNYQFFQKLSSTKSNIINTQKVSQQPVFKQTFKERFRQSRNRRLFDNKVKTVISMQNDQSNEYQRSYIEQSILKQNNFNDFKFDEKILKIRSIIICQQCVQYVGLLTGVGLIASIKQCSQIMFEKQIFAYKTIKYHPNILNIWSYNIQYRNIIIKQAFTNEIKELNSLSIRQFLFDVQKLLTYFKKQGIYFEQLQRRDFKQVYGCYKISNLSKFSETQTSISIERQLQLLKNQVNF